MTITGANGVLQWGYHRAAQVPQWSVIREEGQWTLSGTVESVDAFRVTQRPLKFVTPNNWRWPIVELQMTGASLTAVLGPKEKVNGENTVRLP